MLARPNPAARASATAGALPLTQATALYEALDTIQDVVSGLRCQPRFNRDLRPNEGNEAGEELEDLGETIGGRMEELVKVIRASRPVEPFYQEHRMAFLLRHEIVNDDAVAAVASAAVKAVFQDQF